MSAVMWFRGFLQDEHGIAAKDMNWVQGGLENPGRREKFPLNLPPGFPLTSAPEGQSLSQMLADGALDAVMAARRPSCFVAGHPKVRRLLSGLSRGRARLFPADRHLPDHARGRRAPRRPGQASVARRRASTRPSRRPSALADARIRRDHGAEDRPALGQCRIRRDPRADGRRLLVVRAQRRPTARRSTRWRAIHTSRVSRYACSRSRKCSPKAPSPARHGSRRTSCRSSSSAARTRPLMTTGIEETEQGVQGQFFRELDSCAAALHKFNPDLVVVFGPDHFNGFFYELMPAFCIGTAAEATKDWHLEAGPLRVPRDLAVASRAPSASARLRRGAVARHEGRSRHHHPAVQADRRARALRRAAGVHQLRRRSAPLVPPRARLRRGDRRIPRRPGHEDHRGRLGRPVARSADAAHRPQRADARRSG